MSREDRGVTVTEIERAEAGPRRGGRPTRAEAARREAHLIAVATTLFLEREIGRAHV